MRPSERINSVRRIHVYQFVGRGGRQFPVSFTDAVGAERRGAVKMFGGGCRKRDAEGDPVPFSQHCAVVYGLHALEALAHLGRSYQGMARLLWHVAVVLEPCFLGRQAKTHGAYLVRDFVRAFILEFLVR